jgi:serine/arginine repetitive matrix protein 1
MPLIKGTSSVSDSRVLSKALRSTKFPPCFKTAVEISKINRAVLTQWIEQKINTLLGFEDEIVQSTAVNLFLPAVPEDGSQMAAVDPRMAQIDMAGFLGEEEAQQFAKELWELMIDAQDAPMGIPRKLLEEKKKELAQAKQQQQPRNPQGGSRQVPRQDRNNLRERVSRPVSPPHHEESAAASRRPREPSLGRDGRRRDRSSERRLPDRHSNDRHRNEGPGHSHRGGDWYNDRDRNERPPPHRDDDRTRWHDSRDRRDREPDDYHLGRPRHREHRSYEDDTHRPRDNENMHRPRGDDRHDPRSHDHRRRQQERSRSRSRSSSRRDRPRRRYSYSSDSSTSSSSGSSSRERTRR